ncbi:MAG TPA: chemotaxis protein CheD [Bacillales bacterium]|nr:chemotaxis protein CheD [Bacillales bacterium]
MNDLQSIVKVGIAKMDIIVSPQVIRTVGLGSCVGVVIYDSHIKTAAMAHVMLPDSSLARREVDNPAKFADSAIPELISMLVGKGSAGKGLKAKIAGGAQMFKLSGMNEIARIGPRNVEEVKRQLSLHGIELIAADTGGDRGRTIEFDPETEKLSIRTVRQGISEI